MRSGSALVLALAVLLAGCLEEPPAGPAEEDPGEVAPDGSVHAPTWNLGDHWTYSTPDGDFTLVVTGEEGGDWLTDTTSGAIAYYDALHDASYIGAVRKSDLAGSQGGSRVEFFRFPLEDGKEWNTRWDGLDLTITATAAGEGAFDLVGVTGGRNYVEYGYDVDTRFMKEAAWFDENGTETWSMRLTGSGADFRGTLQRYEIGASTVLTADATGSNTGTLDFDVQWNELAFRAILVCAGDPAGQIAVGVNSPDAPESEAPMFPIVNEPEAGASIDCMSDPFLDEGWIMENSGGTWETGLFVGAPNGLAHLFIEERSREEVAFP